MMQLQELYCLNGIPSKERIEKLIILLGDQTLPCKSIVDLPSSYDVMKAAFEITSKDAMKDAVSKIFEVNGICATLWIVDEKETF